MQLPRKMVSTACHQFMPVSMSDDASMYVGTHADMLIHRTARSRARQVRSVAGTGARSRLKYAEVEISARNCSISMCGRPDRAGSAARLSFIPILLVHGSP